ncbi:MAG: RNA methyltransferase [Bacteroidetes bacterium]|nr:RNA methyltransferase [Bacteroidota bacterium]
MRKLSMEELERKSTAEARRAEKFPIVLILENIRSAYNVGSAFRTADAFQVEAIYLTGYTAFPPHKEIRKTALGAEDSVVWRHFPDAGTAIERARSAGYKILAVEQTTESQALQSLHPTPEQKIALVFGNEVTGIESETLLLADACLEIPQGGMKHSLNVATALGIAVWECVRSYIKEKPILK